MATADELLAAMEADPEAYTAEEIVCTIDPETRTISVPQSLQLLGVESDQEAVKLPFRCPKIVGDNIDLSTLNLRINYQNAGGELDIYRITDMAVDGSDIKFSWRLDRKVTAYKGTPIFAFCAKKPLVDGTLKNEWNTTPNKECKVLEGLEAEEVIVNQNPDILESILTRLDTLEAGGGGTEVPGKQVELRNSGTAIQWKYDDDTTWTDLILIADITGQDGKSAYEYATEGGYTGTEEEFTEKLAKEYVGFEDYASTEKAGIVKITNRSIASGIEMDSQNRLTLTPLYESEIIKKSNIPKCPIMLRNADHVSVQTTHQEMSDTYDPDTAKTPDGDVPYAYGGRQPVSYNAVKEYINSKNTSRIEMTDTDTTAEIQPNKLYVFPEMTELTLTFAAPTDTSIVNEYHIIFTSGSTATTLTIPDTIKIPDGFTVEANKIYELSVLEGCLSYMSWDTEVTT